MWRRPSEGVCPKLAGEDPYAKQTPIARSLPLWGGCSAGGFATVLFHKNKKLTTEEWTQAVTSGKLVKAIKALRAMDLADAMAKRPVLSKQAYLARVKRTLATKRAQQVATNCANQLRKTCREVKDNKGAATRR